MSFNDAPLANAGRFFYALKGLTQTIFHKKPAGLLQKEYPPRFFYPLQQGTESFLSHYGNGFGHGFFLVNIINICVHYIAHASVV